MSQAFNQNSKYILSRFKPYDAFNQPALSSAPKAAGLKRFSLVDDVLDVEYNEIELKMFEPAKSQTKTRSLKKKAAGLLFKGILYLRLVTYYVLHSGYRPL